MCLASSTISTWQLVQPFLPCTETAIFSAEILSPWQPRQVAGSMARPCAAAAGRARARNNSNRGMRRFNTRSIGVISCNEKNSVLQKRIHLKGLDRGLMYNQLSHKSTEKVPSV